MRSRRKTRQAAAIATTFLAATLAAACSSSSSSSSSPAGAGPSSASSKSSNPASAVRIAIVTRDFTNPYWAALRAGALAEGTAEGVQVTVQAGSSETDTSGEDAKLATLSGQDYNCYGVVPVDATNVITSLVPIARKKIPILNLDTQISPSASAAAGVSYASFIGSDNVLAGQMAGKALLAKMGGGGQVAILQGIAGEQNGINRQKGFTQTVQGKLQIVASQPANYDENLAQTVTSAILQAHPGITGIFAANDTMGLGAAQAVKNAGKAGKIAIVSVDGIQDMLQSVKSGANTGTVTQYPYAEGQIAVQACINLVAHKTVPSRIVSPIAYISSANVDQAIAAFPKPIVTFTDPFGPPKS
jgi:ribose transport system substrate-binding protein